MVTALYGSALLIGPVYWVAVSLATGFAMFSEIMAINRSVAKDRLNCLSGPFI